MTTLVARTQYFARSQPHPKCHSPLVSVLTAAFLCAVLPAQGAQQGEAVLATVTAVAPVFVGGDGQVGPSSVADRVLPAAYATPSQLAPIEIFWQGVVIRASTASIVGFTNASIQRL